MSHFAVAVITDGDKTVEEMLAPYQENSCSECPRKYMEFFDTEGDSRSEYHTGSAEYVITDNGSLVRPWDEMFRVDGREGCYGATTHKVPDNLRRVSIPYTLLYKSFDDYMTEWCGEERDKETGRFGYWENPNAKWDWWMFGGRWRGRLRAHNGSRFDMPKPWSSVLDTFKYKDGYFDQARLGDIVFDIDKELYDRAVIQWKVDVEGDEIDGVEPSFYSAKYFKNQYGTRDNYALCESTQWWRAVITPDGEWHEVGEMLWWGISTEENGAIVEWAKEFKARFIDPYPDNYLLTVVDCHI